MRLAKANSAAQVKQPFFQLAFRFNTLAPYTQGYTHQLLMQLTEVNSSAQMIGPVLRTSFDSMR